MSGGAGGSGDAGVGLRPSKQSWGARSRGEEQEWLQELLRVALWRDPAGPFKPCVGVGILFRRSREQMMILNWGSSGIQPVLINDLHKDLMSVSPFRQQAL